MAPPRERKLSGAPRAKPHERKKAARAVRTGEPLDLDKEWAEGLRRQILDSCHPYQRDAVEDPSEYISLLCGRGGGKTTVMRARALLLITAERGVIVAYVATSKPEARRLNWRPTLDLIRRLGAWDDFEILETRLEIVCKRTGSIYAFFGAENRREANKLRGQAFRELQIDEAASHDIQLFEYLIDESVDPRLGESEASIVIGGTPGRDLRGLFYEATRPGSGETIQHRPYRLRHDPAFKGWLGWSSHHWTAPDVLALPDLSPSVTDAIRKNWERALRKKQQRGWIDSHPIWLREYLAIWAADATTAMYQYRARLHGEDAIAAGVPDGALWNRWEPFGDRKLEGVEALKAAIAKLPRDVGEFLYGYGIDLGGKDPFALSIAAFAPADARRRIWQVYGFERRKMYTKLIAELLIGPDAVARALRGETYDPGGLIGVTGWPVARVADLAALGEAIITELAEVYGIKFKPAEKKHKKSAIEVANGDLTQGTMFILPATESNPLETQLATLQWKPDEYGNPQEDKAAANHSADSWTYIRTEIGSMYTGSGAPPPQGTEREVPEKERVRRAGRRERMAEPEPNPVVNDRGEFGGLLSQDNFPHIDRWGNG